MEWRAGVYLNRDSGNEEGTLDLSPEGEEADRGRGQGWGSRQRQSRPTRPSQWALQDP